MLDGAFANPLLRTWIILDFLDRGLDCVATLLAHHWVKCPVSGKLFVVLDQDHKAEQMMSSATHGRSVRKMFL